LKVTAIYNIGSTNNDLELDVYDEAHQASDFDLNNIVEVNFYPGYKVYFHNESTKGFSESTTLPNAGEEYRNTLMGAISVDQSNNYKSSIGTPAILMAQEIVEPKTPSLPVGPLYAMEPNQYNKATYTFSVQLQHNPYAVIFYRADLNAILYAIYKPETVKLIKETLPAAADDVWFSNRWQDLLNFPTGIFADFPIGNNSYHFPNPDKYPFDGTLAPNATSDMSKKVKAALYSSFLPLTKEPILYKNMQNNTVITVLKPAKISTSNKVQFTDFTLDVSMITSYFYCVREVGNRMDLGAHSSIAGPVQLVNTTPSPAPVVRKMIVRTNDLFSGTISAVLFQVNDFPNSDRVTHIRVFRAETAVDALSIRTMKMVKEIAISTLIATDNLYFIEDNFQDLAEVPYGDPLFYRIVSVREVPCQDVWGSFIVKYVPSYPTKVFLANIIDTINPQAPEITINADTIGDTLTNIVLNWTKTTYKGRYFLFKMSNAGQWNRIHTIENTLNTSLITVNLVDTNLLSNTLSKVNEDGDVIYHRFKVAVESTSGLLNLSDMVLTV
jgi:hypothetical protein